MKYFKYLPFIVILISVVSFFYPFLFKAEIPVPADTIIGLYHPFRDLYAKDYPRGIPFKNSLITDPVRQQYPWRYLSVFSERGLSLPLWNPYSLAGTPLMANMQSAPFYILNILFLIADFRISWGIIILFQPLLAGFFMYLYLKEIKCSNFAGLLGSLVFAFCGFSVAWMEWGTVGNVALWTPLLLLSVEKITQYKNNLRNFLLWSVIYVFSLGNAFFAGHLQVFFYLFLLVNFYFLSLWFVRGKSGKILFSYGVILICFLFFISLQLVPALRFISLSAREIDQVSWQKEGWFLPPGQLIQFFAPDFFGNPSTMNYWGVWNYGEFIGYIGIIPLILALFALFFRYDKKVIFFGTVFFLSLIFALPSFLAKIPFILKIPLIDTSQPSRLLFLTDFSLAVLGSLGMDYFISSKYKYKVIYPLVFIFLVFVGLWIFVLNAPHINIRLSHENIIIARNNLILPGIIFFISIFLITAFMFTRSKRSQIILIILLLSLSVFDLYRFAYKFISFSPVKYLFPESSSLKFLTENIHVFRYMSVSPQIMPPNFSVMYKLQSVDGYDPLYLARYGELIAASERNKPDINPPFGFNRIINPGNYDSKIIDLLGVKYVLSLTDINSPKLKKVFSEGETKIYENKNVFPRAFFVKNIIRSKGPQMSIDALFDKSVSLRDTAVVEGYKGNSIVFKTPSQVKILKYSENNISLYVKNQSEGFLVLTDSYYPTWHVKSCSLKEDNCRNLTLYLTDFSLRGVVVPPGEHKLIFYNTLL